MVCTDKDPPPNINIPVVMVSNSSGVKIQSAISDGKKGEIIFLVLCDMNPSLMIP
jgi:signal peptide peptidase-like protein 2B